MVPPGNENFFIVNQGYDTTGDNFRPTQNDTSLKDAWTIRLSMTGIWRMCFWSAQPTRS